MAVPKKKRAPQRKTRRLHVEPLEPRVVLSTLSTFDGGMWEIDLNDNQTWDGLGGGDERTNFGIPGDTAVVGDWDGDGTDDLGIFRAGKWFFDLDGDGGMADSTLTYGIPGDAPVAGDWDGDGVDEVAVFRNGVWYFDLDGAGGAGEKARTFGIPGDVPVAGDWDGDGIDEMGVFRSGLWFFDLDDAGGFAEKTITFGIGGDRAAYGDWDGDGRDDLAVFRAGKWFFDLDGAGGSAEHTALFGAAVDTPLIIGHPPLVDAGVDAWVKPGEAMAFSGQAMPRFAEQLDVSWDFGDGASASDTLNPSHTYSANGTYTVTLTATNQFGKSWQDQATVTVAETFTLAYSQAVTGYQTHTGDTNWTDVPEQSLAAANFVAGRKYLILARSRLRRTGKDAGARLVHGETPFPESTFHGNIFSSTNSVPYVWFTVWTAVPGEEIKRQFMIEDAAESVTVGTNRLIALELSELLVENTDFHFRESGADSLLTTAWTNGASVTFTPPQAGKYLILAYEQFRTHATDDSTSMRSRIVVDGNVELFVQQEGKPNADLRLLPQLWWVDLDASSHTIKLQASATADNIHTRIHSALFVLRLDAFEDHVTGKGIAEIDLGTTEYGNDLNTETFSKTRPGDMLFLGSVVADLNRLRTLGRHRLQLDGETNISSDTEDTATAWDGEDEQANVLAQIVTGVGAGSHTIRNQASGNNPGGLDDPYMKAEDYVVIGFSLDLAGVSASSSLTAFA